MCISRPFRNLRQLLDCASLRFAGFSRLSLANFEAFLMGYHCLVSNLVISQVHPFDAAQDPSYTFLVKNT